MIAQSALLRKLGDAGGVAIGAYFGEGAWKCKIQVLLCGPRPHWRKEAQMSGIGGFLFLMFLVLVVHFLVLVLGSRLGNSRLAGNGIGGLQRRGRQEARDNGQQTNQE
jgi:hypothetical protein